MAVVNKIDIKKMKLKSCSEFALAFKEAQGFDEVRVIFDRFTEESLKSGTRTGRTEGETLFAIKFVMILLLNNFCLI